MSVLSALYKSYNIALENNMVDQTEMLNHSPVLLPVYHSSKKSAGVNDIIEITLSEEGNFIKAEWLQKDSIIIFPITEDSIIRSGKVISPHPISDELSYLSKELNVDKHKEFMNVINDWYCYTKNGNPNFLLETIYSYLVKETIFMDCVHSLFGNVDYIINDDYSLVLKTNENTQRNVKLEKCFVTFKVEIESSLEADLSVSKCMDFHKHYIDFVKYKNSKLKKDICDISGEVTYCISRHRGLMGNAKLISISNNDETYYGRFRSGNEIVRIGYEVSQKIHLMLKYLLENSKNYRWLGENCYLINWFSDDINNNSSVDLTASISTYDDLDEDLVNMNVLNSLGWSLSSSINDYITGKNREFDTNGRFYLMIIDKISNGRISIKYFREFAKSELYRRVESWYDTTKWPLYVQKLKKSINQTPALLNMINAIYGLEDSRGFLECKNSKLKMKSIERLLPCIIENRRFPLDMSRRIFANICNRSYYDNSWNYLISVGCAILKKCQLDYQKGKEVSEMLNEDNLNVSYLFGRLLAVYEKLELDTYRFDDVKRSTNAERLWTPFTKTPARTLLILEEKIRPYKERLRKSNYSTFVYYEKLITEIVKKLNSNECFYKMKNKPLNENFVFGYYGQKQDFYKKRESSIKEI